ncbi:hypothetical protein TRFO_13381 [Tritrichomonas foetus]|uniref:Uncharacterized protein n=1 Tax=Tritrichomonas foetus TaxID=1144522 RepID=A0A1J4KZC8_9EUKA|nr:hypothetical protein TRFO_13381 [Tritrichomonas foetus]|eukprot:OHT16216.1 hypothetical protein TRFO_13381 [Tritrichomonas foetus]
MLLLTLLSIKIPNINNNSFPLILFFDPLDKIEFSAPPGIAIIGGWPDKLEVNIEILNKNGRSVNYGPFTNTDGVFGAANPTNEMIFQFYNNGVERSTVAINWGQNISDFDYQSFEGYSVEEFDEQFYKDINLLEEPILYSSMKSSFSWYLFVMFETIMGLLVLIIFCIDCYCCQRCCHTKNESDKRDEHYGDPPSPNYGEIGGYASPNQVSDEDSDEMPIADPHIV